MMKQIKITEENVGEIRWKWLMGEIELDGKPIEKEKDIKVGDLYNVVKD